MDVRLAVAMARRVDESVTVSGLCADLGISRETFYVYQRRFAEQGVLGLLPRSRAPHAHPNRVSVEVEDAVVAERGWLAGQGLDHGAVSVWSWMTRAGADPPSARTIHRILVRRGLVVPQPQKRPRSSYRRFRAERPNECWQIDGMDWHLADETSVCVIRVIDDHSRKVFRAVVADTESGPAAWRCVQQAMAQFGRPAMLLSDNSLAFNGRHKRVRVAMEKQLRELGVAQVAASPEHPQTCGKAEREHQTLQRWLRAHPAAKTQQQLQRLIDAYDLIYNTERAHQGLGRLITPDECYQATTKAVAADHPLPEQAQVIHAKVGRGGTVAAGHHAAVHIGSAWAGVTVEVVRDGNHVAIFYHRDLIRALAIDPTRRYQPSGLRPTGRPQPAPAPTASSRGT